MKRNLAGFLLVVALLFLFLSGCAQEEAVPIAFVVPAPQYHTLFLESAWESVLQYSQETGIPCQWYEPQYRTPEYQMLALEEALASGAELVVFPSCTMGEVALEAQEKYPDIHFIILDGLPNNNSPDAYQEEVASNTCALVFDEQQAGFLAGYAAVMEGFTRLGFLGGMAQPPVVRFGYGYLYGAEYAAQHLELPPDSIEVRYVYSGTYLTRPECQTKAASWYWEGTQVIFACAGDAGKSVLQAADSSPDAWVIGVDYDQSLESEAVLASAVKHVAGPLYQTVRSHFDGSFPGGSTLQFGLGDGAVGLSMDSARFQRFLPEDYQNISHALLFDQDGIASGIPDPFTAIGELPLSRVNVLLETMR